MSRSSADLAVLGARIRTLDPARPFATAVAVRDGLIAAVGSDAEVREACDGATEVIDGSGLAVVPGLTDAHIHPLWAMEFASGVEASACADMDEWGVLLRAERERVGPNAIVRTWGLDYHLFAGREIEGRVLEELAGGPAFGVFADLHTYLATPSVLGMADITGPERFPDASEIVCDGDGTPTGLLREFSAFYRLTGALPAVPREAELARVRELLGELNAHGITGAHVMNGSPDDYTFLTELEALDGLTVRMVVPLWVKPEHDDALIDDWLGRRDAAGTLWRGGTAKFFIDGVIETGTAWLDEPDARGDGTAPYWPDPDRFAAVVGRFADAGFQIATHAIGDRAVRFTLDAYRAAGPPVRGRHRIEHLEIMPDTLIDRMGAERVAASMQPLHMQWRTPDGSDAWSSRLGHRRAARAFRTADMLRTGIPLALGSDWPVASYDPRFGMAWAQLRRQPGRRDAPGFEPEQRLTGLQALEGYTTGAATVVGDEDAGGRITPGRRADLTAFASDPVDTPPDDLVDVPVRLTVVGGRVVFRG
jgi:predicted amidohydrolase YtcJ